MKMICFQAVEQERREIQLEIDPDLVTKTDDIAIQLNNVLFSELATEMEMDAAGTSDSDALTQQFNETGEFAISNL